MNACVDVSYIPETHILRYGTKIICSWRYCTSMQLSVAQLYYHYKDQWDAYMRSTKLVTVAYHA